jgi:hypothetical protein
MYVCTIISSRDSSAGVLGFYYAVCGIDCRGICTVCTIISSRESAGILWLYYAVCGIYCVVVFALLYVVSCFDCVEIFRF